MSHKRAAALGWRRVDPKPWTTKLTARWEHTSGWTLGHCGHPTALRPWAICDPAGVLRETGWNLENAFDFVAVQLAGGAR